MTLRLSRLLAIAVPAAILATAAACESLGPTGAVTGEVRSAREVALPEGTVVTIKLLDTTLADAPSMELGRDVIENADRLPVSFRIEYDRDRLSDRNEYSLSSHVRHGDDLLYVNDTVHPVLTRGAPGDSDVVVVSTNPFDTCVAPLPGQIHSEMADEDLPSEAVLHVRLIDVTDPEARLVLTETTLGDLGRFPIKFGLPSEDVQISRHRRYELEAEIVVGDETLYHIIPRDEWRRIRLPHCPNADQQIVNSVFPVSEFSKEQSRGLRHARRSPFASVDSGNDSPSGAAFAVMRVAEGAACSATSSSRRASTLDRPHISGVSSEDSTNRRGMPRRRRLVRRPVADDSEESALISPRLLLRGRYRRGGTRPARWAGRRWAGSLPAGHQGTLAAVGP